MNPIDSIWTEKYRPKKVADVVGDAKDKILKYLIKPESMPHFLFHSTAAGCGKTSLAKAIINELGCDSLIINSSDDRNIDTIRDKIKQFAMTSSSKPGLRRAIFLDEVDGMLKHSQDALRTIMETYASNVFFLLAANSIHKIIDPIRSRCVIIPFGNPDKDEIVNYVRMICDSEGMVYDVDGLCKLVDINYPSIRNCVLALQDLCVQGLGVSVENVHPINEIFEVLWDYLLNKDWKIIKEAVLSTTIDARELNSFYWGKALECDPVNLKFVQVCCRNERDIALGADSKIIFVSSILEMIK